MLHLLEMGLLKLIQSTRRYQKLAAWMFEYQNNYRRSTILMTKIELSDITDPNKELELSEITDPKKELVANPR